MRIVPDKNAPWHESDAAGVLAMGKQSAVHKQQSERRVEAALSAARSAIKAKTAAHTSRGVKQSISALLTLHAKGRHSSGAALSSALGPNEVADLKAARELWKQKTKRKRARNVSKHKYTRANIKAERERVANDDESESEPLLQISLDRLLDDKLALNEVADARLASVRKEIAELAAVRVEVVTMTLLSLRAQLS
jgi:hypothetical protein